MSQFQDTHVSQGMECTARNSSSSTAKNGHFPKLLRIKSLDLITINIIEHATITSSRDTVLDVISEHKTTYPPHSKSLIRVDNATADSWTRKISASSLTGKSLNRLFCSLLMSQ